MFNTLRSLFSIGDPRQIVDHECCWYTENGFRETDTSLMTFADMRDGCPCYKERESNDSA